MPTESRQAVDAAEEAIGDLHLITPARLGRREVLSPLVRGTREPVSVERRAVPDGVGSSGSGALRARVGEPRLVPAGRVAGAHFDPKVRVRGQLTTREHASWR